MTSTSIGSLRCARARLISPNQKRQYRLSSGSGHLSFGFSPIFFASRKKRRQLLRILLCGGHTSRQRSRQRNDVSFSRPLAILVCLQPSAAQGLERRCFWHRAASTCSPKDHATNFISAGAPQL